MRHTILVTAVLSTLMVLTACQSDDETAAMVLAVNSNEPEEKTTNDEDNLNLDPVLDETDTDNEQQQETWNWLKNVLKIASDEGKINNPVLKSSSYDSKIPSQNDEVLKIAADECSSHNNFKTSNDNSYASFERAFSDQKTMVWLLSAISDNQGG
ncbi:unnamed protein product [Parnassius mnemosyne]|uniref:Lipoprotein n=1 Tax=Parnassius mnemosyne TaxID=213953 RepID=A0AAV1KY60_9NEOP